MRRDLARALRALAALVDSCEPPAQTLVLKVDGRVLAEAVTQYVLRHDARGSASLLARPLSPDE